MKGLIILFSTLLFAGDNRDTTSIYPATRFYGDRWNQEHVRTINASPSIIDSLQLEVLINHCSEFMMPAQGKVISRYGMRGERMHTGIDIKQKLGDSILSAFDGVVRVAKNYSGYGLMVVIRHENGLETLYGHCSQLLVKSGDRVKAGNLIGLAGRTGRATTEHLHFETRFLEEAFNPEILIDFDAQQLACHSLSYRAGQICNPLTHNKVLVAEQEAEATLGQKQEKTVKESKSTKKKAKKKTTYHQVKKGDTIYSLARKYGSTVADICKWNDIDDDYSIVVGTRIVVAVE